MHSFRHPLGEIRGDCCINVHVKREGGMKGGRKRGKEEGRRRRREGGFFIPDPGQAVPRPLLALLIL